MLIFSLALAICCIIAIAVYLPHRHSVHNYQLSEKEALAGDKPCDQNGHVLKEMMGRVKSIRTIVEFDRPTGSMPAIVYDKNGYPVPNLYKSATDQCGGCGRDVTENAFEKAVKAGAYDFDAPGVTGIWKLRLTSVDESVIDSVRALSKRMPVHDAIEYLYYKGDMTLHSAIKRPVLTAYALHNTAGRTSIRTVTLEGNDCWQIQWRMVKE
jgi:hypothetical protein